MSTKDRTPISVVLINQLGEALAANQKLAQKVAELERRAVLHDEILNFLKTILYQLKKTGGSLLMTDAQRAEFNRWLDRV